MEIIEITKKAQNKFSVNSSMNAYFAPGRVNLIGEHIDYNGGNVLPCPIDIGTIGIASLRDDQKVNCYSENFDKYGIITFSLDNIEYKEEDNWVNYVKGVIKDLHLQRGFNLYVKGEIPSGAGLSSSASLEILVGTIVNDLYKLNLSKLDLVKIAHKAENEFIGVKCGIMDQFVIGMASNNAILLNTSTLDYQFVDINWGDYILVIGNTNKSRTLASSKYNERRSECERGLEILQKKYNIQNLCELSYQDFLDSVNLFSNDIILKRVKHVISENERTNLAYNSLKNKDLKTFGQLLNQSHQSLKNDYEVSCFELDTLTALFLENNALGARMTGAGFGGCMIALIKKENQEQIIENVKRKYKELTGLDGEFYPANVGKGAIKL